MYSRMTLVFTLALSLGMVSMPAEAAEGAATAASGEVKPKKRKLATAKSAKPKDATAKTKDSKGAQASKEAKAEGGNVSDKSVTSEAPPPPAPEGKKRKLATAKSSDKSKDASAKVSKTKSSKEAQGAESADAKDVKTDVDTRTAAVTGQEHAANAEPAKEIQEKEDTPSPAKAKALKPGTRTREKAEPKAGKIQVSMSPTITSSEPLDSPDNMVPQQSAAVRPWAEGVSQENQQKALKTFREGNTLLKDAVFAQAAIKYREALTYWDHPAIHYNLVLALLNLDRPTEVLVHLNKAMAYGPDPIDSEKYEQARNYKILTEKQLARLRVRCDLEGAVVSMDGQELFVGPGQYEGFVRPGPHSIVAKREGYMNSEVSPSLIPGQLSAFDMVLITAKDATEYRRLWPNWRPWTVLGAGVVVAGVGAALHLKGRSDISDFDEAVRLNSIDNVTGEAKTNTGARLTIDLENKRSNGLRNQKIAMALYGVGGAAVLSGAVLLYINRLRPYMPESAIEVNPDVPTVPPDASSPPEFTILPLLSPEAQGVMATVRF